MALNLFNKYGSRANPPSIDYPQGSVKNRSAPDVKDGTPLDADWANDHQGFFQSILSYFGVTANGTPDKVGASQYFNALMSDPTEARRGMPLKATNAEVQAGTNATKMVTPAALASRTATDARAGLVELATNAEVAAGTDTTRAVTPAGLKSHLGTAATRNVGTSAGNVMEVGAFGLGAVTAEYATCDIRDSGFYTILNAGDAPIGGIGTLLVSAYSTDWILQVYSTPSASPRVWVRSRYDGTTWSAWRELYHTGNLQPPLGQGQTWQDVTASRVPGVNYTNATGRSIALWIEFPDIGGDGCVITIGSSSFRVTDIGIVGPQQSGLLIVPNGLSYSLTFTFSNIFSKWMELR